MGDGEKPALTPHLTRKTVSINEARRIIMQLSQPLADVTELIYEKVYALDQHVHRLNRENQSLDELKKSLYIPVIDIKETAFDQPRTVCSAAKCTKTYTVQGRTKCHFAQLCHNPCYLRNVPREIIGLPGLLHCAAMGHTQNCKKCGCSYSMHMHIYYETTLYETNIKDDNVVSQMTSKEAAMREAESLIQDMIKLKLELESEHDFILISLAKFASFLKKNAITAYNDAYHTYLGYLIDREKSLGDIADQYTIQHLQNALKKYEKYKAILESAKENEEDNNASMVEDRIKELFHLKNCGSKIEALFDCQNRARQVERQNNEYVHHTGLNLSAEPPTPKVNIGNSQKGAKTNKQQQQNNQCDKGKYNKNLPKRQNNQTQNWRNNQQKQQYQGTPQQWQAPYNYQGPPPLFYQAPPAMYPNCFQGPQFNFQPGGPQQNWPMPPPPPNYWPAQQQFTPPQNQQQQMNQQQMNQQQMNQQQMNQQQQNQQQEQEKNSIDNAAGQSKLFTDDAPTGKYVPKQKQANAKTPTQSLEQQYSSLSLQDSPTPTGVYNQETKPSISNENFTAVGSYNQKYTPRKYNENYNQKRTPRNYNANVGTTQNRRSRNTNENVRSIRERQNFKKRQTHSHNIPPLMANWNQEDDDKEEDDFEIVRNSQSTRSTRKSDLVKETVTLAVFERDQPAKERSPAAENSTSVTVADTKAASFFKKLFG